MEQPNQLNEIIVRRIKAEGPLPFAEFMQMALYYPDLGYYTRQPNLIGARGDFYTAPHLTPIFGELVAKQLVELWERLGKPKNFQLVEMGAGQALLTGDVLAWISRNQPDLWANFSYIIVEISNFLKAGQKRRLQDVMHKQNIPDLLDKVSWHSLEELGEITGIFFSNELVDAFPVHLIEVEKGELREVFVALDAENNLIENLGPLTTAAIDAYLQKLGLNLTDGKYPEGYRTEINLAALDWLQQISSRLKQGYLLTIDYGYTSEQRYSPHRVGGTLQAYVQHTVNYNPYQNVGTQDLTSHVDFTALIKVGEELGLHLEGFTTQAAFLLGLGLGEKLAEITATAPTNKSAQELMAERNALQKLVSPVEMGNFRVLLQSKDVPSNTKPLTGFSLQV